MIHAELPVLLANHKCIVIQATYFLVLWKTLVHTHQNTLRKHSAIAFNYALLSSSVILMKELLFKPCSRYRQFTVIIMTSFSKVAPELGNAQSFVLMVVKL